MNDPIFPSPINVEATYFEAIFNVLEQVRDELRTMNAAQRAPEAPEPEPSPHLERYPNPRDRKRVEEAHVRNFIYDCCEMIGSGEHMPIRELFAAYREWLDDEPTIVLDVPTWLARMMSALPAVRLDRDSNAFVGLTLKEPV